MRRLGSGLAATAAGVLLMAAAGCADSGASQGGPTVEPTSDGGNESGDRCALVTDEEISAWSGTELTVRADGTDECYTVADAADPHRVSWTFQDSSGRFAQDVESQQMAGLERSRIDLAGGVEGALLQGSVGGTPLVRVVAPLGEQLLVVEVVNNPGTAELARAHLARVAANVAGAYTSSPRATADGEFDPLETG